MLSKPIEDMTPDECFRTAKAAGLKIRVNDLGDGLYEAFYWHCGENRIACTSNTRRCGVRHVLACAANAAECLRDGCVVLPEAEPPTLEEIAEMTVEECRNFVLDNLPDHCSLSVRSNRAGCCPIKITVGDGMTTYIGTEGTAATLANWRMLAECIYHEKHPAPPKIADMTEEQCEAALTDLGAEWRVVELPHEDGSVTYVGWRLTATTDEWSRARGSKDKCEVMQSIVRWAAHARPTSSSRRTRNRRRATDDQLTSSGARRVGGGYQEETPSSRSRTGIAMRHRGGQS